MGVAIQTVGRPSVLIFFVEIITYALTAKGRRRRLTTFTRSPGEALKIIGIW